MSWGRKVLRGLRRGSPTALAELYDRCAPHVYGISRAVGTEPVDSALITEAVFLHVWAAPGRLRAGTDLADQLQGVALHWAVAHRHLRAQPSSHANGASAIAHPSARGGW